MASLVARLVFLSLLYPSCAWATTPANEVAAGEVAKRQVPRDGLGPAPRGEELWHRVEADVLRIVEEQIQVISAQQPPQRPDVPSPAAVLPRAPLITPPPSLTLYKRQADDQIQQLSGQIQSISQSFRSVSQASQQVSQTSQQLSQSLQQAQQQLSQTQQSLASARASADAARQSADSANQNAQQASRDADQARQSADAAVSSAASSASSAASAASKAAASSAASSLSTAVAAMSSSAQLVMSSAASLVQAAKADATAVRNEADNRVLQAQGTAVSVTQAALAIVGAIVGSSLLTIAAFVMVLRYKRRRRDRRSLVTAFRGEKNDNNYRPSSPTGFEKSVYAADIKAPEPAVQTQRVGFAAAIGANRASFHLGTPPKGKYSVFPRDRAEGVRRDQEKAVPGSPTSEYSVDVEKGKAQARGSKMDSPPSLDKWLRVGTDVSPFGTLNEVASLGKAKGEKADGKNWPFDGKAVG